MIASGEDDLIPGIHNYCDRWCERCEFTSRCSVFALEAEADLDLENSPDPIGDTVRTVAASLAEAKRMLLEKAEEMGIDLETEANSPEVLESLERQQEAVESFEAVDLAKRYALETRPVLEAAEEWAGGPDDDPMIAEMLSIIQWYLFFIAAKVHRGYHGLIDLDGNEDLEELNDPQSDANGSIKIALIAMERSILAWTYLVNPANESSIRPVITRLETIRSLVDAKFPNAREFIRPGFDEIGGVM